MKKVLFTIFTTTLTLCLFAQTPKLLKVKYFDWSGSASNWMPTSETNYQYSDTEDTIWKSTSTYQSSTQTWSKSHQMVEVSGAHGLISKLHLNWNLGTKLYDRDSLLTKTYGGIYVNGKTLFFNSEQLQLKWNTSTSTWDTLWLGKAKPTPSGVANYMTFQSLDGGILTNSRKEQYFYNSDLRLSQIWYQTWNGSDWVGEYSYSEVPRSPLPPYQIYLKRYLLYDTTNKLFNTPHRIMEHQYNDSNELVAVVRSSWDVNAQAFKKDFKTEVVYDEKHQKIEEIDYSSSDDGENWTREERREYAYLEASSSVGSGSVQYVKIYPNPVTNRLEFGQSTIQLLEIIDSKGVVIKTLKSDSGLRSVDCSEFSDGVYHFRAITPEGSFTQQVIVKH
ncbi:MAG: T9SS type A sorting domain-containing protein [Flavobacteriales bacterium]|nr:T9SS type A sorting domain-containing protein [Bacteroidota bacterium]MCB9241482.1 T9SS type A sorting domain-containing protein [Flavobacteriales bacterium]